MKKIHFWKWGIPVLLVHILGWLLYYITDLLALFFTPIDLPEDILLLLSYNGLGVLLFYVFFYGVWPGVFRRQQYWRIPVFFIGGLVGFIVLRYVIEQMIFPSLFGFYNYLPDYPTKSYILDNLPRPWQVIFLSGLIFGFLETLRQRKHAQSLEKAKSEAQVSALRHQINPHFLFNTLGYFHTEAFIHHPPLGESILQLSDLLRYSTGQTGQYDSALTAEIELLRTYIALNQKRFGERCYVELQVDGTANGTRIEPMLLLPFVENAFKHGQYNDPAHPIQITITIEGSVLHFHCQNIIHQHQKDDSSGVGLDNVRRRLALRYPNEHQLEIKALGGTFIVDLIVTLA